MISQERIDAAIRTLAADAAARRIVLFGSCARGDFWHLPRFALYYRELFGELPSETRRRAGELFER
jgi:AraC family ethanolamine operon transcriptional activator